MSRHFFSYTKESYKTKVTTKVVTVITSPTMIYQIIGYHSNYKNSTQEGEYNNTAEKIKLQRNRIKESKRIIRPIHIVDIIK